MEQAERVSTSCCLRERNFSLSFLGRCGRTQFCAEISLSLSSPPLSPPSLSPYALLSAIFSVLWFISGFIFHTFPSFFPPSSALFSAHQYFHLSIFFSNCSYRILYLLLTIVLIVTSKACSNSFLRTACFLSDDYRFEATTSLCRVPGVMSSHACLCFAVSVCEHCARRLGF